MGVYCCRQHIQNDEFKTEAIILFQNKFKVIRNDSTSILETDLMNFLKDIHSVLSKGSNKRVNFDSDAFTDEELTTMIDIN